MPLSDFRDTFAWREAIELSPELIQLAEQLPVSEEMGLAYRLRKAMVELPASIAYDLLEGESYTRKHHIARLAAMLDIIDKVYPALDTAESRKKLEKLAVRVGSGETFGEQTPGAAKAYLPGAQVHAGPAGQVPRPVVPSPPAPMPSPSAVKVTPNDDTAEPRTEADRDADPDAVTMHAPTKVQVTADGQGDTTGDHVDG